MHIRHMLSMLKELRKPRLLETIFSRRDLEFRQKVIHISSLLKKQKFIQNKIIGRCHVL